MKILAIALVAAGLAVALPASAQWTRVTELPNTDFYSVWTNGDTIAAGTDSTLYLSVNAGATWIPSAKVASGITSVEAVRVRRGRVYAGTFGKGVFTSDDLGATWQDFNQGLTGGFLDSQLRIKDLLIRSDTLYASTGGSGAWMRPLAGGTWSRFGNIFGPAQASNMEGLGASPTRLFAAAGANGDVYFRDFGKTDWDFSYLQGHVAAGLASLCAFWTGQSWLIGTNIGAFRSPIGNNPWDFTDFGVSPVLFSSFTQRQGVVFVSIGSFEGTGIDFSTDDGVSWQVLDFLPLVFTYNIATIGDMMYAGRIDGLWRRPIGTVGVPTPVRHAGLHFAIVGPHPVRDEARFRFDLAQPAHVRLEVFDVAGRRQGHPIDEMRSAGPNLLSWNTRESPPGVYLARLVADDRVETVRLVRAR